MLSETAVPDGGDGLLTDQERNEIDHLDYDILITRRVRHSCGHVYEYDRTGACAKRFLMGRPCPECQGESEAPDEHAARPLSVTKDPFMTVKDRVARCEQYRDLLAENRTEEARQLDPDGSIDYMTKAGYAFDMDGDDLRPFAGIHDDQGKESVAWAIREYSKRHPGTTVDEQAVWDMADAANEWDGDRQNAIGERHPYAYYIACAAAGQRMSGDMYDTSPSAYEWALDEYELKGTPTGDYLDQNERLRRMVTDDTSPNDPKGRWKTMYGWVNDKDFTSVVGDKPEQYDRYVIYMNGNDQDRRELAEHYHDPEWIIGKQARMERECRPHNTFIPPARILQ